MSELFDRLDALAEAEDFVAVEGTALDALPRAHGPDIPDLWRYVAWARFEQGRLQSSLDAARRADDPLYQAKALFHLWRFEDAQEVLKRYEGATREDAAEAAWYLGLIEEFEGGNPVPFYRRAAGLAPELFAVPVRLPDAKVDAVIRAALDSLPAPVRQAIENTVVELAQVPKPGVGVDPLTLGLYTGRDRMQRSVEDPPELPARIELYRRNIERIAADPEEAADELRITLLHEVGHHLGFDESGVGALGLD